MSWTLAVPPTPRERFDEAVDQATVRNAVPDCEGDVAAVKEAMKALAKRATHAYVSAHGGQSLIDGDAIHVDLFFDPTPQKMLEWGTPL